MDHSPPLDKDNLRHQTVHSASALMVGQIFRFIISMISQIYLARLLLPADFGLVAMVYPVLGFVQLFADFGLLQAVVQRKTVSQGLLSAIFWINALVSVVIAIIFVALTPLLVFIYQEPRIMPVALTLSFLVVVSGIGQLQSTLLNRQLRFVTIVVIDIVSLAMGLVAGIVGALHGYGYWSLVFSQLAATCTTTILAILSVNWRPSRPTREPEVFGMLRFGGQITGSRVIGYLNSTADNMMIGAALGEIPLGIYDRAWRLAAQPLQQLCAPIDRLAIPVLSRLQDEPERYRRAFAQMVQFLCLLAMPGLLYGVVAADRFIPLLLGQKWLATVDVFRWICIGALISPLNNACVWLFISQSRGADQLRFSMIVSVINVLAYAIGLPWGLEAVARTSAISVYVAQCPILIWAATRTGPIDGARYLNAAWPGLLAIAIAGPILYWLVHIFPSGSVIGIFVGIISGYGLTVVALACFSAGRGTLMMAWNVIPLRLRNKFPRIMPHAF